MASLLIEKSNIESRCLLNETALHLATRYKNYEDLIYDSEVEAVVIASSWDMHTRMAVLSMKAGKYTARQRLHRNAPFAAHLPQ